MRGAKVEHKLQQVKMLDCFILANEQAAEKFAQLNRENKHGAPRSLCSCCATQAVQTCPRLGSVDRQHSC